jgi:dTDP-4-amino-4,6-dideoxygalactose transaminase
MLEMQAVIGRIQLRRMAHWTTLRHANAAALVEVLLPFAKEHGPMRLPNLGCTYGSTGNSKAFATNCGLGVAQSCAKGCVHGQYKFYSYVRPQNLATGWTRDRIIDVINSQGVPCYQGICSEVYLEKAFEGTGWRPKNRMPVAKDLGETSLMFLVHPTLTVTEIQKTCEVIKEVMSQAKK